MPKKKSTPPTKSFSANEFGVFCRARRKALELSLSEFCRLNGFDKGNHSRLERGLLSPPHDITALKMIAKALKLTDG